MAAWGILRGHAADDAPRGEIRSRDKRRAARTSHEGAVPFLRVNATGARARAKEKAHVFKGREGEGAMK